jgi:DNA gyrase subunit A
VKTRYAEPRRTAIVYGHELPVLPEEPEAEDYDVSVFLSREGYFKKITPLSLRMSGEQKFKDGDELRQSFESTNRAEILFFTDRCQVYKCRLSDFDDTKASVLGDYLPAKLGMDEGESVLWAVLPGDYSGEVLFFYENGKAARVSLSAYQTTSNRRKLTGAYSDKSPLCALRVLEGDGELVLFSSEPRALVFHTALLAPKTTRSTQGVQVMSLKPRYHLVRVCPPEESGITAFTRFRVRSVPAAGALVRPADVGEEQLDLLK